MERSYIGPAFGDARVYDAMRVGVITCQPDTALADVARIMVGYEAHSVVVADAGRGGQTVGIVTSFDVARVADRVGELRAADVATSEPTTIDSDQPLQEAATLMSERGVSHLIAVQPTTGQPVGVLSARDIAAAVAYGGS
jgi:CBS domain-containing protein